MGDGSAAGVSSYQGLGTAQLERLGGGRQCQRTTQIGQGHRQVNIFCHNGLAGNAINHRQMATGQSHIAERQASERMINNFFMGRILPFRPMLPRSVMDMEDDKAGLLHDSRRYSKKKRAQV